MIPNHKVAFISFKHFLFLVAVAFAVAATLLTILFTSAATATGSNPSTAISMTSGANTGILGPGEQRWFRIIPNRQSQPIIIEKSLSFVFTSNNNVSQYVLLQLFEEEQAQLFYANGNDQMTSFGTGRIVANDNNPETGKLFWSGWVFSDRTYYIQLLNNSDFPLDYRLLAEDISSDTLSDETEVETPADAIPEPDMGTDPGNPAPLTPDINKGNLKPHTSYWYAFTSVDFTDGNNFQDLNFSMFFTPDDGNRRHNVNFEIFSANEVEAWWRGDKDRLTNFGAGALVSRDGDINTGERIWQGTVLKGDTYFLTVQNGTDVEIDYWLFDDDIYNPELGSKSTSLSPVPSFAQGAAPQTAIPVNPEQNIGGLEPGQEIWYSFSIADFDNEAFEETALTMIVTPDDGNRIRYVTLDVFTADGVRNWSSQNPAGISNVGAGSVVYRDDNPLTGERFWSGWVVDNDLYYVRIRNGADIHIDYWLFTGDVYRPELG